MNKYCAYISTKSIRQLFGYFYTSAGALNVMAHSPPTPNAFVSHRMYKHWFTFQQKHRPNVLFYFEHLALRVCPFRFGVDLFLLFICLCTQAPFHNLLQSLQCKRCRQQSFVSKMSQWKCFDRFNIYSNSQAQATSAVKRIPKHGSDKRGSAKERGSICLIFTIIIPCSMLFEDVRSEETPLN